MSNAEKLVGGLWLMASLAIAVLFFAGADADLRRHYSNGVQLIAALAAALFCFRTCLVFPSGSPLRQVWILLGAGVLAWALGQSYFWLYSVLNDGQETPFPSFAELGFLLIGPLVAVALLRFRHASGLAAPLWGSLTALVLLIAACAAATAYNWEGIQSADLKLKLVSIAYALSDPIMLAVTAWVAFGFGRGSIARSWWCMAAGIALFFIANQIYSFMVFKEIYESGVATDLFWPLSFGLMAWGAARARSAYSTVW
jgi:hypothetical protein